MTFTSYNSRRIYSSNKRWQGLGWSFVAWASISMLIVQSQRWVILNLELPIFWITFSKLRADYGLLQQCTRISYIPPKINIRISLPTPPNPTISSLSGWKPTKEYKWATLFCKESPTAMGVSTALIVFSFYKRCTRKIISRPSFRYLSLSRKNHTSSLLQLKRPYLALWAKKIHPKAAYAEG